VCVLISTGRWVFIGVQGGVTDLVKLVTHQVVVAVLPTWLVNQVVQPPPTLSTALAYPVSCRHMCMKLRAKPT
jgi:hypothetical protein